MSDLIAVLFAFFLGPPETCNSTFFGTPGDKWAGGDALYLKRPVNDRDVSARWSCLCTRGPGCSRSRRLSRMSH